MSVMSIVTTPRARAPAARSRRCCRTCRGSPRAHHPRPRCHGRAAGRGTEFGPNTCGAPPSICTPRLAGEHQLKMVDRARRRPDHGPHVLRPAPAGCEDRSADDHAPAKVDERAGAPPQVPGPVRIVEVLALDLRPGLATHRHAAHCPPRDVSLRVLTGRIWFNTEAEMPRRAFEYMVVAELVPPWESWTCRRCDSPPRGERSSALSRAQLRPQCRDLGPEAGQLPDDRTVRHRIGHRAVRSAPPAPARPAPTARPAGSRGCSRGRR